MAESENRPPVDMSPEAMDQRLRDVAESYRLGMSLTGITYLGKAKDLLPPIRSNADLTIRPDSEKSEVPEGS